MSLLSTVSTSVKSDTIVPRSAVLRLLARPRLPHCTGANSPTQRAPRLECSFVGSDLDAVFLKYRESSTSKSPAAWNAALDAAKGSWRVFHLPCIGSPQDWSGSPDFFPVPPFKSKYSSVWAKLHSCVHADHDYGMVGHLVWTVLPASAYRWMSPQGSLTIIGLLCLRTVAKSHSSSESLSLDEPIVASLH
jgi:hypothetical protein